MSRTLLLIVVLYLVFKPKPKAVHGNVDIGDAQIGSNPGEWADPYGTGAQQGPFVP